MLKDIHAKDVSQELSKIQITSANASNHTAWELIKSESQLMPPPAEDVRIANGQDTFQTTRELNASWDHSPNATASQDNQLTDTHVKNANMDKDKTQATRRDVSKLQDATMETKLLVWEIPRAAMLVDHALFHSFQELTDQNATDQDQLASALSNTHQTDTAASHAEKEKSQMNPETNATQLQSATEWTKFLELDQPATDADLAQQASSQMTEEEPVLDQSQSAHAHKSTLQMVMSAKNVQIDKLLIQTITRDVFHNNVTREVKSSLPETTAIDVISAHKDMSQIHRELSALESSQNAAALKSMIQVDMSACHAHHTKLQLMETKDASQDSAQDSMRFSELPIHAMLVENARRVLLLITWEEDAWDTSLHPVLATKDSMPPDSDVSIAQKEPDHLLIIESV